MENLSIQKIYSDKENMKKESIYILLIVFTICASSIYSAEKQERGTGGLSRCDKMKTFTKPYFDTIRNSVIIVFIYDKIINLKNWVGWNASAAISDFDLVRDEKGVLKIVKADFKNLFIGRGLSTIRSLLNNPEAQKKEYFGRECRDFRLKVLRGKDGLGKDNLVGYIAYCTFGEDSIGGYIDTVVVNKKYRRKGHGQFLLNHAMNELKKMGVKDVFLNVWSSVATKFYEKNGFKETRKNFFPSYSIYSKDIEELPLSAQEKFRVKEEEVRLRVSAFVPTI